MAAEYKSKLKKKKKKKDLREPSEVFLFGSLERIMHLQKKKKKLIIIIIICIEKGRMGGFRRRVVPTGLIALNDVTKCFIFVWGS